MKLISLEDPAFFIEANAFSDASAWPVLRQPEEIVFRIGMVFFFLGGEGR
jgi:hypothetical protein